MKKVVSALLVLTMLLVPIIPTIASTPQYSIEASLNQNAYYQGNTVSFTGTVKKDNQGFGYTPVNIKVEGVENKDTIYVDQILTDSSGMFSKDFFLTDSVEPGNYKISFSAAGIEKVISFSIMEGAITSTIDLDKSELYPGDTLKIDGVVMKDSKAQGYAAVIIKIFKGEEVKEVMQLETDGQGKFSTSYIIDTNGALGEYTVQAFIFDAVIQKQFKVVQRPTIPVDPGTPPVTPPPVTPPVTPPSDEDGSKEVEAGKVKVTEDESGKKKIELTIDNKKLEEKISQSKTQRVTINVNMEERADVVIANIPSNILNVANQKNKILEINTGDSIIELPPGALKVESDEVVKLTASKVETQAANLMLSRAKKDSFKPVSYVIDFTITSMKESQETKITFNKPVTVSVKYDANKVSNPKKLGIYYYNESSNEWEYKGGRAIEASSLVVTNLSHFSNYVVMEHNKQFNDVTAHWAKNEIEILASRHVIMGVDDKNFAPSRNITRAEFAALLVRALDLSEGENKIEFKDVKDTWYKKPIDIAASLGIVTGYDGMFRPNGEITREEMAVMLVRALKVANPEGNYQINPMDFTDQSEISTWAEEAASIASSQGIIKGIGTRFAPSDKATRDQTAVVVYRMLNLLGKI